jgi:hypothetical protein
MDKSLVDMPASVTKLFSAHVNQYSRFISLFTLNSRYLEITEGRLCLRLESFAMIVRTVFASLSVCFAVWFVETPDYALKSHLAVVTAMLLVAGMIILTSMIVYSRIKIK